jgi:hypothetical protein
MAARAGQGGQVEEAAQGNAVVALTVGMTNHIERDGAEALPAAHLGAITAYARRRGSNDADGLAAELSPLDRRRCS